MKIDQDSWDGLLLDAYLERLAPDASLFAREHLRTSLQQTQPAKTDQAARLRQLLDDPDQVRVLETACASLKKAQTPLRALLVDEAHATPTSAWARWLWLPPLLLVLSCAGIAFSPWGSAGAVLALVLLIDAQARHASAIALWTSQRDSIIELLICAIRLSDSGAALAVAFPARQGAARALLRVLTAGPRLERLPGVGEYLNWFFLANVQHYYKSRKACAQQVLLLREIYQDCAALDASLALRRHLQTTPHWCWSTRGAARELVLEQFIHPLLAKPVAMDVSLNGRGAFISGRNGVGKSTLMRAVGLNLLVAQAFGFAYAAKACVPDLPVHASMQSEDSLTDGTSLYIAELQRARTLLDAGPGIFLIDEIFRGTNHLESMSAAAAVLQALAQRGLVLVSSHNVLLAGLLEDDLDALCIKPQPHLHLAPGVLADTNGLALLAEHGFSQVVQARAAQVFDALVSRSQHAQH